MDNDRTETFPHKDLPNTNSLPVSITDISDNVVSLDYPYSIELTQDFFIAQDERLIHSYHQYHSRIPQLLIQLDGIADIASESKSYIQSNQHQKLYDAVAFILSKGNMAVLERHYLEQLLATSLQSSRSRNQSYYPVGIFNDRKSAARWLASRPGSHHRH